MQEHTKKLRINPKAYEVKREKGIVIDDAWFKKTHGDIPKYCIMLKGLRGRECLTQKEFAEAIGIKQSHVSEMENGKREIGKAMAKRISELFNIDYRLFL